MQASVDSALGPCCLLPLCGTVCVCGGAAKPSNRAQSHHSATPERLIEVKLSVSVGQTAAARALSLRSMRSPGILAWPGELLAQGSILELRATRARTAGAPSLRGALGPGGQAHPRGRRWSSLRVEQAPVGCGRAGHCSGQRPQTLPGARPLAISREALTPARPLGIPSLREAAACAASCSSRCAKGTMPALPGRRGDAARRGLAQAMPGDAAARLGDGAMRDCPGCAAAPACPGASAPAELRRAGLLEREGVEGAGRDLLRGRRRRLSPLLVISGRVTARGTAGDRGGRVPEKAESSAWEGSAVGAASCAWGTTLRAVAVPEGKAA